MLSCVWLFVTLWTVFCQAPLSQARVLGWVAIFFSIILPSLVAAVDQLLHLVQLFVTLWTEACWASLSLPISWSLFKLMSVELVMPSNHLILCLPLLLPSIFPSNRMFSSESALHIRWPQHWSCSFSISLSNEYSGLISFRIDWFDLHAVQGTLKSSPTLQFESINSLAISLLYGPVLTSVCDYWKNHSFDYIDLCQQSDVCVLFNMLRRFVIDFKLFQGASLFISWLQSPSTVILEPRKIKSLTDSTFPQSIFHEVMGLDAMILIFWMLSFKLFFSLSSFTLIKMLFSSLCFLPLEVSLITQQ